MSQLICLKWNNHMRNMMHACKKILSTEEMANVTLVCEGRGLKAHKLVLSASSTFFWSLLSENPCKHPIVILNGVKYSELKALLEFMYHGEVNVDRNQLCALVKAADTLRIKGFPRNADEAYSPGNPVCFSRKAVCSLSKSPKQSGIRCRKRSVNSSSIQESQRSRIKSYPSIIGQLPRKVHAQRAHCSRISTPVLKDVSFGRNNSFNNPYRHQEETRRVDKTCPRKEHIHEEQSSVPKKTLTVYNSQMRKCGSFNQSSTSCLTNHGRSSLYRHRAAALLPKIKHPDDSVSPSERLDILLDNKSQPSEFRSSTPDFKRTSNARNGNSERMCKGPMLPNNSPLIFSQPVSKGVAFTSKCPVTKAKSLSPVFPEDNKNCSELKSFQCSYCSYSTSYFTCFECHVVIHTGEKPYVCSVCGKIFTQKLCLQIHTRLHIAEKPYACNTCGKRFNQKVQMTAHVRTGCIMSVMEYLQEEKYKETFSCTSS